MKTYVFKVTMSNGVKFVPVSTYSVLNAVDIMKSNGWKTFVLV